MTHEHAPHRTPETAADWDARYGATHIWSGEPNGALMALTSDLAPGTALDVGCGEGADAVWLARRGWTVTGLDVSRVAVDRARAAAEAAGVEITWLVEGFGEHPLGPFDLVSAQYPAVPKRDDDAAERAFADAVAPGGRLVFVHHELDETPHGFDPADYVMPEDVVAYLTGQGWQIETDEIRERHLERGAGSGHSRDRMVVARRGA